MDTYNKREEFFATELGRDCIDLNSTLARWLGRRLLAWHNAGQVRYPIAYLGELEAWREDTKKAGEALLAYVDPLNENEDVEPGAVEAMKWVAENFPQLWD
jgi:hypothetical protein